MLLYFKREGRRFPFFYNNHQKYNKNSLILNMQRADQKLSKNERLKSRKLIQELFEKAQIFHQYPFKVLFSFNNFEKLKYPAQIGISVSKRNFKHAVDRNRIKRKIKESYRQNKHLLYNDLEKFDQNLRFFVIYTAKADIDYSIIEESMTQLIKKIMKKLNLVEL
jgi:ribonuclease P protein component